MSDRETKQPRWAGLLGEVMDWHRDPESSEYNECEYSPCLWCAGAAAELEKARIEAQTAFDSSALVLLHARWLENAAIMENLAEEEPEDSQEQLECYERMRTLRDCASQLKATWAGMKENEALSNGGPK